MGFRDSRLRGKIDGIKAALSLIRPEAENSEFARTLREQLAEAEAELKRITTSS